MISPNDADMTLCYLLFCLPIAIACIQCETDKVNFAKGAAWYIGLMLVAVGILRHIQINPVW